MQYRPLGRTPWNVSAISFGAWAIGGTWGQVDDRESLAALHRAIDLGVNFIDTADVYGDGRSERLIAQVKKERPRDTIIVATKAGRRLPQQTPEGYTRENLTGWIERSLKNLQVDALDLLQLHCPHPAVYDSPAVFGILDDLIRAGKIRYYGISVETVDEALRGIAYPNVQTVQIIFNKFRTKPAERFFPLARQKQVGILARVQDTIFVKRDSRADVPRGNVAMANKMQAGEDVLLFGEGTSSDGQGVLAFKPSHFAAARDLLRLYPQVSTVTIQPAAIAYVSARGKKLDAEERRTLAWFGDDELAPHIWTLLKSAPVECRIAFGPPLQFRLDSARKQIALETEGRVREIATVLAS